MHSFAGMHGFTYRPAFDVCSQGGDCVLFFLCLVKTHIALPRLCMDRLHLTFVALGVVYVRLIRKGAHKPTLETDPGTLQLTRTKVSRRLTNTHTHMHPHVPTPFPAYTFSNFISSGQQELPGCMYLHTCNLPFLFCASVLTRSWRMITHHLGTCLLRMQSLYLLLCARVSP